MENKSEEGVECLCGTENWKVASPEIWGKAKGCWTEVDFEPSVASSEHTPLLEGNESVGEVGTVNGMWPKYRPWKVGLYIEEGRMNFRDVEVEGVTK